ncbi:MAG: alpha-amylase family glycosyl hydrolase [Bacteroidetes bacterium]|jgi:glycosidase|nr:alpha-amylase family glycosyl hydrolase [Bacteroidota bacterium]
MKNFKKLFPLLIIAVMGVLTACENQEKTVLNEETVELTKNPDWAKDAVIYEVNTRQFTEEGTFEAFANHLPRLKELGVDILWFMPIHPIGEKNRKGTLGSYYSIKDYTAVNPEFGDLEAFKAVVAQAHEMGFKVILDWVANHTAFDHAWTEEHPEWYNRDENGEIISPYDWTDVADLDYENNPALWDAMIDAMKFWVVEADIDGYRCDVAGMVPVSFWERTRKELDEIKPVFMLAEDEGQPELTEAAFGANYGWEVHHIFNKMAQGEKNCTDLWQYLAKDDTVFEADVFRMTFTSNHDENSWNGTVFERLGDGAKAFAVLSYTLPGFPLIYNGQEVGLNKRLSFFEKDQIDWNNGAEFTALYTTLNTIKKENPALWNASEGGTITPIQSNKPEEILAFIREKDQNKIVVFINTSPEDQQLIPAEATVYGTYTDLFSGQEFLIDSSAAINMPAWSYLVLKPAN